MNDRAAFARLVQVLAPWKHQLVFVGEWAHRLYRLHPMAEAPAYPPLATLDADVAFAERERLEGSIKAQLLAAGFQEQLMGNHQPPVSQYTLGEDEPSGFYAGCGRSSPCARGTRISGWRIARWSRRCVLRSSIAGRSPDTDHAYRRCFAD